MRIVVLGGYGLMGKRIVRDLVESEGVSEVIIAGRHLEKAKQYATELGNGKLSTEFFDASDDRSLLKVMKDADVVANCLHSAYNVPVMKAAIEAGVSVVDLGAPYYRTLEQFELDNSAKDAGITVIMGCGVDPGISNMLAKYAADRLDRTDEVHIAWYSNISLSASRGSARTVFDEARVKPVIYKNGELIEMPLFSGEEVVGFPEPIGRKKVMYVRHAEPVTIPRYIKGIKVVGVKGGLPSQDLQRLKLLSDFGLISEEPILLQGIKITPADFLIEFVTSCHLEAPPEDEFGVRVEIIGEKAGDTIRYLLGTACKMPGLGTATAELTGVPCSIAAQMVGRGYVKVKGVLAPEGCLPPESFFTELAKRGIIVHETVEVSHVLLGAKKEYI